MKMISTWFVAAALAAGASLTACAADTSEPEPSTEVSTEKTEKTEQVPPPSTDTVHSNVTGICYPKPKPICGSLTLVCQRGADGCLYCSCN